MYLNKTFKVKLKQKRKSFSQKMLEFRQRNFTPEEIKAQDEEYNRLFKLRLDYHVNNGGNVTDFNQEALKGFGIKL